MYSRRSCKCIVLVLLVLLVEQNVRAGLTIATYGVVMESGVVRMQGEASSVRTDPEMNHLFFGGTLSEA